MNRGLSDSSAYVRKTAALSIAKLLRTQPSLKETEPTWVPTMWKYLYEHTC